MGDAEKLGRMLEDQTLETAKAINRALRAEAKLAEYENDETPTRRELALVKRKLEEPTRCNSGHETLPLKLWTCPTCHEELERKLEAIEPKAKMLDMMTEPEHIDSFLEATTGIEEHPDGYDEACMCQLCCSYAD